MAPYNTSKAGEVALVRTAALDLAAFGIRVNGVAPGVVRTRISEWVIDDPVLGAEYLKKIPLGRFGEPADIAQAVAFLASADAELHHRPDADPRRRPDAGAAARGDGRLDPRGRRMSSGPSLVRWIDHCATEVRDVG